MTIAYAHLLIVDTDEKRLQSLVEPLKQYGWYAVTGCKDIPTALFKLSSQATNYDVVMIDVALAARDEYEFLRRVQVHPKLNAIPVLVMAQRDQTEAVAACLEKGAVDYLLLPAAPALVKARLSTHLQQRETRAQALSCLNAFNDMKKLADDLREVILPLGIALSAEKDFDRLLETIVIEAKKICNADGGTLYLRTEDDHLRYVIFRTNSLNLAYGGTSGNPMPFPPLPFYETSGRPNHHNVATYVALEGQSVNIPDVYNTRGFDFAGVKKFDQAHNYHTISCLTVPMKNNDVIGVLQLLNAKSPDDNEVAPFTIYHKLVAESLASQAAVVLHNHVLRQRQVALLQAERELQIGRQVQAEFFPTNVPQPPGWDIAFYFEPSRLVAGDFYDVFHLPYNKIGLVIADVCDKGVGAAIFMAQVRSLLRAFIQQHYFLGEHDLLGQLVSETAVPAHLTSFRPIDFAVLLDSVMLTNVHVGSNHGKSNMFVTLFLASLDPETGEFIYINAGHLPPLHFDATGQTTRLMPTGPAIGLMPEIQYQLQSGVLQAGDTLLAYTDGVTEARNSVGEMFGRERLLRLVADGERPSAPTTLLQTIVEQVHAHHNAAGQDDDITMLAVHRRPQT